MRCLLTILFAVTTALADGQSSSGSRAVYFELCGSGGIGSFNYEKSFRETTNWTFVLRAGLSLAPIDRNNGTGLVFPIMVHAIRGKGTHKLDLGLGQGITITTKGNFFALTTAAIGYRHQSSDSPWLWRISYTPLISYLVDFQVQQWGGFAIGYTLKSKAE